MGGSALKTVLRVSQWKGELDEAEFIKVVERGKEGRGERGCQLEGQQNVLAISECPGVQCNLLLP